MNRFDYVRAQSVDAALRALPAAIDAIDAIEDAARPATAAPTAALPYEIGAVNRLPRFLAGGTNLVDLMKEGVMAPSRLIDIGRLALPGIDTVEVMPDGRLRIGALMTNAATANHPLVCEQAPLLRSAILAGASPQIRNRATNGGNLLQRTRCVYFYDAAVPCNKRAPGSGCPAATGLARQHAILGASPDCVATHPSDMCVALAALDAQVHVVGPAGARVIAFEDFHRLPGDRPDLDTTLAADELVTHLMIAPADLAAHACYLKLRERASYAFALVSVAAALRLDERGDIADARLALGGVAHKPWRDRAAEQLLIGGPPDEARFAAAARAVLREARPCGGPALPESLPGNQFKIPLAERAIVRALGLALAGIPGNTGEDAFRTIGAEDGRAPTAED